jgi:spore coat protein U-like protein
VLQVTLFGVIMKKIILSAIFATSACSAIVTHAAGTDSAQFQVKITVNESCKFSSAQDIEFNAVDRSTKARSTAKGQLNVTCTKNTPYNIALEGTGAMSNTKLSSASKVPYKLYQDAARTAEWDASNLLSKTGNGKDQAIPVYAKLAGDTNVEAGNYVDTVIATVTY